MSRTILGESPAVKELLKMINTVSRTKTNILVIGESGTGKELVARMIHDSGPLKDKPFVPVNCGAIPETLIESEMFGHKRGSFTGAVQDRIGLFEAANGGTLFLDEVGELPLSMQVKLLRAIQERVIRKVGGTDDIRVDVRIIAATNRDLEAGVAKGTFREDLYYRLNVILIKTPSLRSRQGDISLLADHFLKRGAAKQSRKLDGFSSEAMTALEVHEWPGNIRELENVVERAVTLEPDDQISLSALPGMIQDAYARSLKSKIVAPSPQPAVSAEGVSAKADTGPGLTLPIHLEKYLEEVERPYVLAALEQAAGSKKKAADLLGLSLRSLRYRMTKLGIKASDDEVESEAK